MKRLELGVFLPIANNGFLMSESAPQYLPSYVLNRDITLLAENIGLDYVFSMSKWRGYGGSTEYWDHTLESITLMSALAAVTQRISLIATVNPLLFHPALIAKMVATADDISDGRFGLNIITGGRDIEYSQMGVVPENYDRERYSYAEEWIQVVKRLWTEDKVTHHGKYFNLVDCVSSIKPRQRPYPFLVCAGTSEEGIRFTVRNTNYAFIAGGDIAKTNVLSHRAKAIAAEGGHSVKTAATTLLVMGDTRKDAEAVWQRMVDGADTVAIENIMGSRTTSQRTRAVSGVGTFRTESARIYYTGQLIIGSPEDIVAGMMELAVDGDLDSVQLLFPDYLQGLEQFSETVMPLLRRSLDVGMEVSSTAKVTR